MPLLKLVASSAPNVMKESPDLTSVKTNLFGLERRSSRNFFASAEPHLSPKKGRWGGAVSYGDDGLDAHSASV